MRPLVVVPLMSLLAVAACVPEFSYGDGSSVAGSGGDDGGSGGRSGRGGGGGERPGVVVGVGPGGGGPSVGPGPGPGTSSSTTQASSSTGVTATGGGGGGEGDGGAASTGHTTTATTTGSTGSGGPVDDGAPCWDANDEAVVSCNDGQVCCYDVDYYSYHECDLQGACSDYAYELECNDAGDCGGGQLCCVNLDGFGDLTSITCETSCQDLRACSALEACPDGLTCYYVFDPDSSHDEYDAYGFCYEE